MSSDSPLSETVGRERTMRCIAMRRQRKASLPIRPEIRLLDQRRMQRVDQLLMDAIAERKLKAERTCTENRVGIKRGRPLDEGPALELLRSQGSSEKTAL